MSFFLLGPSSHIDLVASGLGITILIGSMGVGGGLIVIWLLLSYKI